MKFLLGRKRGMTQIFDDGGKVHPVTVVETGPCIVTQVKSLDRDGYHAVQIGFEDVREKRLTKPLASRFKKSSLPPKRHLREVRLEGEPELKVGDKVGLEHFEAGDVVDVVGKSKGKGFQGTVKAHGFTMGARSHGSMNIRQPGSVGAGTGTGKLLKGLRMAKHLGDVRTTAKNLELVKLEKEKNLLYIRGTLPGMRGSLVMVREARTGKKSTAKGGKK